MGFFSSLFASPSPPPPPPTPSSDIVLKMDLGKYFHFIDDKQPYAELLTNHPAKQRAIAELFIFRAWATQLYFHLFSSRKDISERITSAVWNDANTLGRAMLKFGYKIDIETVLGGSYIPLADSRWKDYAEIFLTFHDSQDKLATGTLCLKAAELCGFSNNPLMATLLAMDLMRQMVQIKDEAVRLRILT